MEDQEHQTRADQAQSDRHHARYRARFEGGFQCALERGARLISRALIGKRRHAHADVSGHIRCSHAQDEKHRNAKGFRKSHIRVCLPPVQNEQQDGDDCDKRQHRLYLLQQVGQRAIPDRLADLFHARRARAQTLYLAVPDRAHNAARSAPNTSANQIKSIFRGSKGGKRNGFRSVRRLADASSPIPSTSASPAALPFLGRHSPLRLALMWCIPPDKVA